MKLLRLGGFVYGGIGKDGIWRTSKFDYYKDNQTLRQGTAKSIAHSLKFKDVEEVKKFLDDTL